MLGERKCPTIRNYKNPEIITEMERERERGGETEGERKRCRDSKQVKKIDPEKGIQ